MSSTAAVHELKAGLRAEMKKRLRSVAARTAQPPPASSMVSSPHQLPSQEGHRDRTRTPLGKQDDAIAAAFMKLLLRNRKSKIDRLGMYVSCAKLFEVDTHRILNQLLSASEMSSAGEKEQCPRCYVPLIVEDSPKQESHKRASVEAGEMKMLHIRTSK